MPGLLPLPPCTLTVFHLLCRSYSRAAPPTPALSQSPPFFPYSLRSPQAFLPSPISGAFTCFLSCIRTYHTIRVLQWNSPWAHSSVGLPFGGTCGNSHFSVSQGWHQGISQKCGLSTGSGHDYVQVHSSWLNPVLCNSFFFLVICWRLPLISFLPQTSSFWPYV